MAKSNNTAGKIDESEMNTSFNNKRNGKLYLTTFKKRSTVFYDLLIGLFTMRFESFLIAVLTAATTDAAESLGADALNKMLQSGNIDTKSLLKNAIPNKKRLDRNLEENGNNDGEQSYNGYLHGYEITGDKSVQFNRCVTLSVQQEFDEDIYESAESSFLDGSIRSVKNYVLFNVCTSGEDCQDMEEDSDNTYLVELGTWVNAMVSYLPDKKDEFCTGCQYQESYCYSQASYAAADIDYDMAYFTYNDIRYQLINCEQCFNLGWFDQYGDAYEQNGWESVAEWMEEIGECYATGSQWQNLNLYAGWMCNGDGDGMEIAVFMDEECTFYNSNKSFKRILGNNADDWLYYSKSTDIVSHIFNTRFNCYGGDITYINLMQEVYLEEGNYDPCQYDNTTGQVLDYDECQEMLYEVPCYSGQADDYSYGYEYEYDGEDGDGDGEANQEEGDANQRFRRRDRRWLDQDDQDQECAEYMEQYPCWTMPGEEVAEEYQEACYEYQLAFKPQAMESCTALFGENDDEIAATALSDCAYSEDEQQQDDAEENGEEEQWDLYLAYDIYANGAENAVLICQYIEGLFNGEYDVVDVGYDHDNSGTLYGDATKGGGTYFPTINSSSLRKPKEMGTLGIVLLCISVIAVTFVLTLAINRIRKSRQRQRIAELKEVESKELPFLS